MLNFSRLIVNYSETIDKLIKDWELRDDSIFDCFSFPEFDGVKNNRSLNDYDYLYLSTEINHPQFSFTRYWIKCIIHAQQNKCADNYEDYKFYYNELMKTKSLSNNIKASIELENLNLILEKDCFKFNNCKEKYLFSSLLNDISNMISNGYIFKNKISSFRFLLAIFSNNLITENLSANKITTCLNHFNGLHVMAKKIIFKNLIKKKQEAIILNLLDRGINLNWMIDFEGNGKEEVCSLKLLENLKLSDVLFSNIDWNILAQNSEGDNILHIMCGSSLLDGNLSKLNIKMSFLNAEDKYIFLNERNDKGLTPLAQAILLRDEDMVNFLIENGINKWSTCKDNPLEFLEDCINGYNDYLLPDNLQNSESDTDLWHHLLKDWVSEKFYTELQGNLASKKIKEKSIKI